MSMFSLRFYFRISNSLHGSKFSVKLTNVSKKEVVEIKHFKFEIKHFQLQTFILRDATFGDLLENVLERWGVLDIKNFNNPTDALLVRSPEQTLTHTSNGLEK